MERFIKVLRKAGALPPCKGCDGEHGYADETCEACGSGPFCFHYSLRHENLCIG